MSDAETIRAQARAIAAEAVELRAVARRVATSDLPDWRGRGSSRHRSALDDEVACLGLVATNIEDLAATLQLHATVTEQSMLEIALDHPGVIRAGLRATVPWL